MKFNSIQKKQFKTKRLILKMYKVSDYPNWKKSFAQQLKKQSTYDSGPLPANQLTLKIFKKKILRWNCLAKKDQYYVFPAFDKKTGLIVGVIDIYIYMRRSLQMANFGYKILNNYWGKGYGKEMSAMGLKIGLKDLKLHRLEASIDKKNQPSIALAKSLKMQFEGVKKKYIFKNGKWIDQLVFIGTPEIYGIKPVRPKIKKLSD